VGERAFFQHDIPDRDGWAAIAAFETEGGLNVHAIGPVSCFNMPHELLQQILRPAHETGGSHAHFYDDFPGSRSDIAGYLKGFSAFRF